MDVREKLVELLNSIIDGGFKWHSHLYESGEQLNNDEIASHLIDHGVTVQEWIPVTERLPEVDQPVMIFAFGKSVGEGVYRGHNGFHHVWKMYTSSGTYWDDEVTHWQPLPQPPKEG